MLLDVKHFWAAPIGKPSYDDIEEAVKYANDNKDHPTSIVSLHWTDANTKVKHEILIAPGEDFNSALEKMEREHDSLAFFGLK